MTSNHRVQCPRVGLGVKILDILEFFFFLLLFVLYGIIQFKQHVPFRVFLSVTSDRKVQCPRVGLEVKIYDTPAGGIHASQGTFF